MKKLTKKEKNALHTRLFNMLTTQNSIPNKHKASAYKAFLENFYNHIEELREKAYAQGQSDYASSQVSSSKNGW